MLYTSLPGKTDHESHGGTQSFIGYRYLVQAGFVRPMGKGLFGLLPLGKRVENQLKAVIAQEMEDLGGLEMTVPMISPQGLWQESGRINSKQSPFVSFKDRSGRTLVLSPTHEESVTALFRDCIHSHKDLPLFVFQFQLKFRDELRPRGGLIRSKEFLMKDGYSFHRSYVELNNFFPAIFASYQRLFKRCGLDPLPIEADSGFMEGSRSYEFIEPHEKGKNVFISCKGCSYRASQAIAQGIKDVETLPLESLEQVDVDHFTTIDALREEWKIPLNRFVISKLHRCKDGLFVTVYRASDELSNYKLKKLLGCCDSTPPEPSDYESIGQDSRCISPFGLPEDVKILVDDAVMEASNLVVSTGEWGSFYKNVNFGRDFDAQIVGDIVKIRHGQSCSICGETLVEERGIELGHIFKLDDYYSRKMRFTFQNLRGEQVYPFMGSYGIGVGRLLEMIAEKNHDERGLIWPFELAPFKFYLMGTGKSPSIKAYVKEMGNKLGRDVLVDDRLENIGTKFHDFDLLGIPLRIVVGRSYLERNVVELYSRKTGDVWEVSADGLENYLFDWVEKEKKTLVT